MCDATITVLKTSCLVVMCSIIDRQLVVNNFFEIILFFYKAIFLTKKSPGTLSWGHQQNPYNPNSRTLHLYTDIHF